MDSPVTRDSSSADLDDDAVDRDFLARPHPQAIADGELADLDFVVGPVFANASRSFRRQLQQRLDRA
jgi:hypothetical protein